MFTVLAVLSSTARIRSQGSDQYESGFCSLAYNMNTVDVMIQQCILWGRHSHFALCIQHLILVHAGDSSALPSEVGSIGS